LKEHLKGTHMSRLAQVIQEVTLNRKINNETLHSIADELLTKVDTDTVYLKVRFDYPLKQQSLKSVNKETGEPNFGWMYYPCTIELKKNLAGEAKAFFTIEFQYSSTCPCSYMMSESWRAQTGHPATPHAQRSTMETTVELDLTSDFHIEDLIHHHREAITTEVLGSIVKREDELSFAILNAEQPMFVEDAVRYMYDQLNKDARLLDFRVVSSHHESLHDHDATAIVCKDVLNGLR
jgi:GTP cyclohydrolase I